MNSTYHNLVAHLAVLANLPLKEDDVETYSTQLQFIMEYMDQIKSLSLDTNQGTARISEEENVFRDDLVTASLTQKQALHNASHTYQGFFVVERILDKD